MTPTALNNPIYQDETAARRHFEKIRWPEGPVCFHCGCMEHVRPLEGQSMGDGWWYCGDCKNKFTCRQGTLLERSHVPIHKWLLAMRLMASSKKGISAHQLHRTIGVTYKTAWFLAHRIREAMGDSNPTAMGGWNDPLEVDETFIGSSGYVYHNEGGWKMKRGLGDKMKVVTLVERGGRARSIKVDTLDIQTIGKILSENADPESILVTDEAVHYRIPGKAFKDHQSVNHSKGQYVEGFVTTNTVEGFFSIFKRGMKGVYQHCADHHLQRYLNEFDFRYSNRAKLGVDDGERTTRAVKGVVGKRLTYRRTDSAA